MIKRFSIRFDNSQASPLRVLVDTDSVEWWGNPWYTAAHIVNKSTGHGYAPHRIEEMTCHGDNGKFVFKLEGSGVEITDLDWT